MTTSLREPRVAMPRAPTRSRFASSRAVAHTADARSDAEFRWLAKRYRAVVSARVDVGEQLRAILQGRDKAWGELPLPDKPANLLLIDIRRGRLREPSPIAGVYRRLFDEEQELLDDLTRRVERHPAWPWLRDLRGIGAALSSQLLARLDRDRAPRPSSFWAFCGLATVGADVWFCTDCGARAEVVQGRRVPRVHRNALDRTARCATILQRADLPGVRIAQTRAATPRFRSYDQIARKLCHLIGVSMLRTKGAYEPFYRAARERFAQMQPEWPKIRCHASALRVMEKRFLLELWHEWPPAQRPAVNEKASEARTLWLDEGALPRLS
jgi:hypothetical protein